jgi:hypothetical protein
VRSTTGHTFGAYASAPWNSSDVYINAVGCFLFLVENPHGDAPTCFKCKNNELAMCGYSDQGPTFGDGHDLLITSDGRLSYTSIPNSYTDTLGRGQATFTTGAQVFHAGIQVFNAEDYEVWAAAT